MSLDNTPTSVAYALKMAKEYYTEDKYNHAMRVMEYVAENEMIPFEYKDDCIALALMHDLIEDTKYTGAELPDNMYKALKILSKSKEEDYITYIKHIKEHNVTKWGMCAYWVKLADMKDHLTQRETLTDKLRDKYLEALPYLL